MKKTIVWSITVLTLAVGFFMISTAGGNLRQINKETTVNAGVFRKVHIQSGIPDVQILQGNSNQIKMHLKGQASPTYAEQVDIKMVPNGDKIELLVTEPELSMIQVSDLKLTIDLPQRNWDSLNINTSSGNIDLSQWKGNEVGANEITLKTGSGDIIADQYKATTFKFDSGSGNMELLNGEALLQGKTGSGNIDVEVDDLKHSADLETGSGNVTAKVARKPESLAVDFQGGSGEGQVEWEDITYKEKSENGDSFKGSFGDAKVKLKVRTGSGNFTLGKRN